MLTTLEHLIKEANILPTVIRRSTYLELCKYPGRRFEEICSRLLCYYLNPDSGHPFGTLFMRSVAEQIEFQTKKTLRYDFIDVTLEVSHEGRYLDILIETPTAVVGIENKVTAPLYNKLDIYNDLIKRKAKGRETFSIVLSVTPIRDTNELRQMLENSFINIIYKDIFRRIRQHLPNYNSSGDAKSNIIVEDFLETIDNLYNKAMTDIKFKEYYYKHKEALDTLYNRTDEFYRGVLADQRDRLNQIFGLLTSGPISNWQLWYSWEDGHYIYENRVKEGLPVIGVECTFIDGNSGPCEKLDIYISCWTKIDSKEYESFLEGSDKGNVMEHKNKKYILFKTLNTPTDPDIIEALKEALSRKSEIISAYCSVNGITFLTSPIDI